MSNDFAFFTNLCLVIGYFACFGNLFVTSWVRELAEYRGFVDRPDGKRKSQKAPVALGGGVAILISTAVAIAIVTYIYAEFARARVDNVSSLIGLGFAAVLLCLVGVFEDLYDLRGLTKLIWQVVAACIVAGSGSDVAIDRIRVLGQEIPLYQLGVPLAVLWLLAAVNSLNLIDGMDGLATTVGLIFSITIGVMSLTTGRWLEAVIAFCLAGSLMGFLRHNWPPAKIYLGDSGSMLIGLVLGTLAIRCDLKDATSMAVSAPVAIFAIPFIDSAAALIRRKLTGRSLYATDRGHIHHRLLTQNFSNRQVLLLIAGLCTITCVGSIAGLYFEKPFGLLAFGLVLLILVGTRLFGHAELMLLNNRIAGFGRRFIPGEEPRSSTLRLQGSLEWEDVWNALVESASKFKFTKIRLNLYLPHIHEDFFATWQRRSRSHSDQRWNVQLPLVVDGTIVGVLKVTGVQDGESVAPSLSAFAELVEPLELQLGEMLRKRELQNKALTEKENEPTDGEPSDISADDKPGDAGTTTTPITTCGTD